MKKLLALLLSALLLLGACACAEEAAPVAHSHALSDVCLISGEQVIDLTGLRLELDVSGADKPDAGRVHLDADGETAAEIGLTTSGGNIILHLASESLGHVDYAIDPVALIARFLDQGVNGLVQLLQSLDTTEAAQSIVDAIAGAGSAPEQPEAPAKPAPQLPEMTLEGDVHSVLLGCVSEPERVEMGGVEYAPNGSEIIIADGTYTTREFTFDTETLCTILNMIYLDGEPSGWGDRMRETGVRFELHGSFQTGEDEGLNQIASVSSTLDTGEVQQVMTLNLNTFYGSDGERTTAVNYGLTAGEQSVGLSFNLTKGRHEGEAFTPGEVDPDSAIVLTDMEPEAALGELGQSLSLLAQDATGALISPLMEAMLADVDMSELAAMSEEAAE